MGSDNPGTRRSDEQLDAILFETATWTINGRNGEVLCAVPSLRQALERAAAVAASGAVVVAVCQMPGDNIIVFEAQGERLRKLCAGREGAPFQEIGSSRASDTRVANSGRPL